MAETVEEVEPMQERTPSYADLKRQETQVAAEEEADVLRRRQEAQHIAEERGLVEENLSSKEATPRSTTPAPETTEIAPPLDDQDRTTAPLQPHVEEEAQKPSLGDCS